MAVDKLKSTDNKVEVFKKLNAAIDRTDVATSSTYGTLRAAADEDEINCGCTDASITPNNLYKINNYRLADTGYSVNDTVAVPYNHNLQLKCTIAGVTSAGAIDTKNITVGQTLQDGTVIWQVEKAQIEYKAGAGIDITNGVISNTQKELSWGNLTGDISAQTDLKNALDNKQDVLTAGDNIKIENNVISSNGLPIGQIISMNCGANYVPEGCLPCDGAEYSKAQFEQLWENYLTGSNDTWTFHENLVFNNAQNEEIEINGACVSNLGNNHLSFTENYNTFKLKFVIANKTQSNGLITFYVTSTSYARYLYLQNGYVNEGAFDGSTTNSTQLEQVQSTTIYVKCESGVLTYSFDDITYFATSFSDVSGINAIGACSPVSSLYGYVDLSQSSINNEPLAKLNSSALLNVCTYLEYEQDLATYGQCGKFAVKPLEYDGSNLTIVGSPTVTADGVASGFSTSDYVQINSLFSDNTINTLSFQLEITPASTSEHYFQIRTADNNNQIVFTQSANKLGGFATSSGTSYNFASMNIVLESNVAYLLEYVQTADTINIQVTNKVTGEIQIGSISAVMPLINSNTALYIGRSVFGGYTQNTIDLKQFSISVDNATVLSCGVGDTFKVPTIKDGAVVQQAMSDGELGKAYNAGLPNITGSLGDVATGTNYDLRTDSAFSVLKNTSTSNTFGSTSGYRTAYSFDASLSSPIYGNSETVQMNAVALRYFVVVANGQLNESQMNWSEWASGLQSKANTDGSNWAGSISNIDGQWVFIGETIISTNTATGTYTLDLSEILPNDSYNYEVLIRYGAYNAGSTAAALKLGSDIITDLLTVGYGSSLGPFINGSIILPVGQGRYITEQIYANALASATDRYRAVYAYRRIGKNV